MKAMKAAVSLFLLTALIGGFIGWAQTPRPSPTNASAGSGGTCAGLAGDVSGTCAASTVTKINGTSFVGTSGHLTSFGASNTPADSGIVASAVTQTIGSGTIALATSAIASAACTAAQTVTITGTAATDTMEVTFNADPTAVTGYTPSTNGMLTILPYPTTNTGNVKVCNNTSASITPGAVTLNVRVVR